MSFVLINVQPAFLDMTREAKHINASHSAEELEAMDQDDVNPPPVPKLKQSAVNGA